MKFINPFSCKQHYTIKLFTHPDEVFLSDCVETLGTLTGLIVQVGQYAYGKKKFSKN